MLAPCPRQFERTNVRARSGYVVRQMKLAISSGSLRDNRLNDTFTAARFDYWRRVVEARLSTLDNLRRRNVRPSDRDRLLDQRCADSTIWSSGDALHRLSRRRRPACTISVASLNRPRLQLTFRVKRSQTLTQRESLGTESLEYHLRTRRCITSPRRPRPTSGTWTRLTVPVRCPSRDSRARIRAGGWAGKRGRCAAARARSAGAARWCGYMPACCGSLPPLSRLHGAHAVDDVLPRRAAAARARDHVVEGQIVALVAAILALEAVAQEHVEARERRVARGLHIGLERDHRRQAHLEATGECTTRSYSCDDVHAVEEDGLDRVLPRPQRQREIGERPVVGVQHQRRAGVGRALGGG